MHIVALAWMFVVLLMTLTEATSTQGTVLGALITLLLYGVLPLALVLYLMGTPLRRKARQAAEAPAEADPASVPQRDGGSEPAGAAVAAERKEP